MLFNPLDAILGSAAKVRILRALLPLAAPVSGREAQHLAGVKSRRGTSTALDDLSDLGVLLRTETRGSHLYQVNREHDLVMPLVGLFEAEERRLRDFVSALRLSLAERKLVERLCSVVLYGSNARRDATPQSDVDLLVVVDSDTIVSEVKEALYDLGHGLMRRQGLRISPYVLTVSRVRERAGDRDPFVGEVRNEGRLLMGEELDSLIGRW
jgi:predicted nucleotidyltransferase